MNASGRPERGNVLMTQDSKVVKREDYLAKKSAEALIDDAKRQAEAILAGAKVAYETEKQKGYRDGIEKANRERVEHITEAVGKTIDYLNDIEKHLVQVVVVALRKILDGFNDEQLALRVVRQGLDAIRGQQRVVVRVPLSKVKSVEEDLERFSPRIPFLEVIGDAEIDSDGCVLESDLGIVDCSIRNQLDAIESAAIQGILCPEDTADVEH